MLGDDYISQHVLQSYREYTEKTTYMVYMSDRLTEIASFVTGGSIEKKWSDLLHDLDGAETPEKQTETEQEIKSRLLAKLNGREGE